MKKLLLMTGIALVLVFGVAGLAYANGGPHGGYTPTTDACAGCHRAHTASGPMLLLESSTYALCMSCHGSAGSGANTNVSDGLYDQTRDDSGGNWNHGAANSNGESLLGGGFANYVDVTDGSVQVAVTSNHLADGTMNRVWGGSSTLSTTIGVSTTLAVAEGMFDCASCHDPHGNSNYRMLKTSVNGLTGIAVPQVDEGANKDYGDEGWDYGQAGGAADGLSTFCSACHRAYHATGANSGSSATAGFTHRLDMAWDAQYGGTDNPEFPGIWDASNSITLTLPLADDYNGGTPVADDIVVCTTCHFAHGSSASMATLSEQATLPGLPVAGNSDNSSALLRLDNRGVCEVCHQK